MGPGKVGVGRPSHRLGPNFPKKPPSTRWLTTPGAPATPAPRHIVWKTTRIKSSCTTNSPSIWRIRYGPRLRTGGASRPLLPACQMIFDVVGDILADRRQLKQLVLDDRVIGLLGKLPIRGRLVPEIVRPIHAGTIPMGGASRQLYAAVSSPVVSQFELGTALLASG